VFVFHDDEKPCIVAKELDTTAEGGLGVDCQTVGIKQDDGFEGDTMVCQDVGFSKKLEFVANKLDAFPMGAIDHHDMRLNFMLVLAIDGV